MESRRDSRVGRRPRARRRAADWALFFEHLTATLDTFKVPEREENDVLAFVASVGRDIVEKP